MMGDVEMTEGTPARLWRFAAAQFATGMDVDENLAVVLRMMEHAARQRPEVLVLPEFCNHASWYYDADHAYRVAVPLDGVFLQAVADSARRHGMYVMVNVTMRREQRRITGTNVLYGPDGSRIAVSDKQVLMGNENNFLSRATTPCPQIDLPFGQVGLYSCMDGVINETPRGLALRGARVLLNSLNSFALDEAALHVPVRAAENKVFVVAANKVGPLVPPQLAEAIAARIGIDAHQLHGAGESQIVGPDGQVLAIAPLAGEAIVTADVDPAQADDKHRPDGTHIFASRRPALYAPLARPPAARQYQAGASEVLCAVVQPDPSLYTPDRVMDDVRGAAESGAQLIVLPEMAASVSVRQELAARGAEQTQAFISRLQQTLRGTSAVAVFSGVEALQGGWAHVGVMVGADGVLLRQPQLHRCGLHPWVTALGDGLSVVDLPWGRVAMIIGADTIYPEVFRLAALQDVEVVACPLHQQEAWEARLGLPERAAENRLAVVAACRMGEAGRSLIAAVGQDFTLWTPWKSRPFDGRISVPELTYAPAQAGVTLAAVYPACAGNRMVSQQTDLVDGRPWQLLDALVS
jgi:predicted amidohydrolase